MNGAIREYIENNIENPRYDLPRWASSAPVAGVDTINLDFGNTYQGYYIHTLVAAVPAGIISVIQNTQGENLLNINPNTNNVTFEYVILNRRLIFTSTTLTAAFSVGFQLIVSGAPGGNA